MALKYVSDKLIFKIMGCTDDVQKFIKEAIETKLQSDCEANK